MEETRMYRKTHYLQTDLNTTILKKNILKFTWQKNEKVMDIGMGDGKFTVEGILPVLPKDFDTLLGCDIDPSKIEYAKTNYNHERVQYIELDIQTNNLRADFCGRFDHIFSFYVLQWVPNAKLAMKNIYDIMKPGGEFLITFVEKGMDKVFHVMSQHRKWSLYGHEEYISQFFPIMDRIPLWRDLLEKLGFTDLEISREYVVYRYEDSKTCDEMYKSINPIIRRIPQESLDQYFKDYLEELRKTKLCYAAECPETKKQIGITEHALITLFGRKPYTK